MSMLCFLLLFNSLTDDCITLHNLSRVCTVVQYAVLEAMTRVYGKTENLIPSKYKMTENIQTSTGTYEYVVELSCCATPSKIGTPSFVGKIGKVLSFFLSHTQSGRQTNSIISSTDRRYEDLKLLWLKTRFTPRYAFWEYRWCQIMFRGPNPPKTNFGGPFNAKPIIHCVPKKHVTTFSMISWSRTIRLQRFLAHLLPRL